MKKITIKRRRLTDPFDDSTEIIEEVTGELVNIHGYNWCLVYDSICGSKRLYCIELSTVWSGGYEFVNRRGYKQRLLDSLRERKFETVDNAVRMILAKYNNEPLNKIP